jgi:hypothetical protein
MKNITKIIDAKLESMFNVSYYVALLLRDVHNRLSAEQMLGEFREKDNVPRRCLWLNMLTANELASLNARNFGLSAGESDRKP